MAIRNFLSRLNFKSSKGDKEFQEWIKNTSGFVPGNIVLYHQAFSHSSSLTRKGRPSVSNERLEFLGDAILGSIIAEHLFRLYPYKDEGFLTQLRSKIVNGQNLKHLALKFGFNHFLKTGLSNEERSKSSAYGDAFEAFIGAVYLDKGYEKTKKFVLDNIIKHHVDIDSLAHTNEDYKSQLQILCQKKKVPLEYKLLSEKKDGAQKLYTIQVFVNGKGYVKFENHSKRQAEQKAAQLTLMELLVENG